jgi:hydrogenase maturation protein HypF
MLLENEIGTLRIEEAYPLLGGDWGPVIADVLRDKQEGIPVARIAAKYHNALVNWIVEVADRVAMKEIVLSGGVFQNRYLTERAASALESRGFVVHAHRQVPPNDGGIALGQVVMGSVMRGF